MIKTIILIALVCIQLPASDSTGGSGFVEQVFLRTGTVCAAEEAQRRGMSFGDGIRIGKNTNSFELIKLQIHVVCTGMETAKQVGSWLEFRDPVYGGFRAAPFKAGGDVVLIVHFEELGALLTKSVPSGEAPEEDWTQPEAPRKRNACSALALVYKTYKYARTLSLEFFGNSCYVATGVENASHVRIRRCRLPDTIPIHFAIHMQL